MTGSKHIVCPSCAAINRVPDSRSATDANCGSCKAKLFAAKPLAVNGASFDRHTARNDIAVLVDVWAPWCGPCRSMAPQFERAAEILEPDVRLLKLNSDEEQAISARYGIRSIPTMLLFKDGKLDDAAVQGWEAEGPDGGRDGRHPHRRLDAREPLAPNL